ncbi:S-adenosylmethionine synthase [Trichinella spiralis]|uniref:S-adenosylmethionine synthase n=1 Tax=Trichinella spiralis TaxID=6334 RepID=A0ABR3KJC1_TRISP
MFMFNISSQMQVDKQANKQKNARHLFTKQAVTDIATDKELINKEINQGIFLTTTTTTSITIRQQQKQ